MDRNLILPAVLGLHLAVAVGHGASHGLLGVGLPAWQNGLVVLTTFVGPIAGVALDRRDHRLGVPLFAVSMAAGLVLGGLLHFLLENPDHVRALPGGPWQRPFQASAVGIALTQAGGVLAGGWAWATEGVRQS